MNLVNDLLGQLSGAPVQQVSQQLGVDPGTAESAIQAALPMLIGALGQNAQQPQGAEALFGALQNDHQGLDIGSVLGAVLGSGNSSAGLSPQAGMAAAAAPAILGHIFGGKQQAAEQTLGSATGLNSPQTRMLMQILAPIVMAYLAKRFFGGQQAASPTQLQSVLGQEQEQIRQQPGAGGLLGSLLDQDGDGQLGIGDALSAASRFLKS